MLLLPLGQWTLEVPGTKDGALLCSSYDVVPYGVSQFWVNTRHREGG